MKHLLVTTIAALVLVGCGPSMDIHDAAEVGDIEKVKQFLAAGTDINTKDNSQQTPLHYAAKGQKELAKFLIEKGAAVNARGPQELTPLFIATMEGKKEIVELLLTKGADVHAKDFVFTTALHFAARIGHEDVAELLITRSADVNAKMEDGRTPLLMAAIGEQKEIAELLISNGAQVNATAKNGNRLLTALDEAIETNQTELANLLRKHGGKTGEELKAEGK